VHLGDSDDVGAPGEEPKEHAGEYEPGAPRQRDLGGEKEVAYGGVVEHLDGLRARHARTHARAYIVDRQVCTRTHTPMRTRTHACTRARARAHTRAHTNVRVPDPTGPFFPALARLFKTMCACLCTHTRARVPVRSAAHDP
jgi:hypothetical protein